MKKSKSIKVVSFDLFGTLVILRQFKYAGYKIAFVSNLAKDFWLPVLEILQMEPDYWILSFEVGARKPECKIFQELIEVTHVAPNEIIHIGDKYKNDYQGAQELGIRAVHLIRKSQNLEAVKDLYQFREILEKV